MESLAPQGSLIQRRYQAGCICSERRQSCTKPYERTRFSRGQVRNFCSACRGALCLLSTSCLVSSRTTPIASETTRSSPSAPLTHELAQKNRFSSRCGGYKSIALSLCKGCPG